MSPDMEHWCKKIEHCNKWVSDEESALKEMERRHQAERQEQQVYLSRAVDALAFARGYLHALVEASEAQQ